MVWIVWVKWILYTFYICLEAFWVDSMVVNNTVCLLRVISVLVVSLNSSKQRWSLNYKQSHVCFRLNVTYVCERLLLLDVSKLRLLVITVGWSVCLVKNVTACGEEQDGQRLVAAVPGPPWRDAVQQTEMWANGKPRLPGGGDWPLQSHVWRKVWQHVGLAFFFDIIPEFKITCTRNLSHFGHMCIQCLNKDSRNGFFKAFGSF